MLALELKIEEWALTSKIVIDKTQCCLTRYSTHLRSEPFFRDVYQYALTMQAF